MEDTLLKYIYECHQWLSELEKEPRDFGTGEFLNPSEIHTLAAVERRPRCNLTKLADELGISKAATSKFTSSLARKGYLVKHLPEKEQGRDVFFTLTVMGKKAVLGHKSFTRSAFRPLLSVEQKLSVEDKETIKKFLEGLLFAAGKK